MGCGPSKTASVVPKSRLNGTVNSVKPTTCINPTQPTVNNVKLNTDSIKRNVDHAEPTVDSVEPAFDPVEPTSKHAEPTVDHDKSTPDSVESTIDPVQPTANPLEPNIDSAEPSLNPDEQTIDPVPNIDLTVDSYEQTINSIEPTVDPLEQTADPVEQNVDPVKPTADPVEQDIDPIEPIIDRVEPIIDPVKPTVDPVEATVDHTEPTVEPVEPNIDPSESTVDHVESSEDHTEPTVDPVEPNIDPAEATVDPVEPTVYHTEPTEDPVEPSIDPAETTVDPVEPTVDHTEPTIDPFEPADYPVEPAVDSAEQTDEQAEPTVDPGEPTVDPSKATVDPDKPTISPDNQNADPVKQNAKSMSYAEVDEHARKAPSILRNSPQKLVAYLSKPSSEPEMIVRAIYVWISENIAYDTDGFFGRAARAPCDAEAVMRGGRSVCEGYANVMEMLCREASIPVKKLSGYSKGYGVSADKPFSTSKDTNHAWNAVQLGGKWFLIDSTWGAGHLDTSTNNTFKKEFNDFYFLTDPRQFVNDHFPYIDGDMEASMKWQPLEKPITLEEFNKSVKVQSAAFKLGVRPVSHKEGLIRMKDEVTLSFRCDGKDEVVYMASLMHKRGNMLYEMLESSFGLIENGLFTTRIHPHTTGTYRLDVFGKKSSEDGSFPRLFEYVINCTNATDDDFSFPYAYIQAQTDRCILIEPLQGKLKQNSAVNFHITTPCLTRIMINRTFLEKSGSSFKGTVKTGSKGASLSVFGSREDSGTLSSLYRFEIV